MPDLLKYNVRYTYSSNIDLLPPSDWQMSFSQSAPVNKHNQLDQPVDCPSTTVA